jgi:hypothetical protein
MRATLSTHSKVHHTISSHLSQAQDINRLKNNMCRGGRVGKYANREKKRLLRRPIQKAKAQRSKSEDALEESNRVLGLGPK